MNSDLNNPDKIRNRLEVPKEKEIADLKRKIRELEVSNKEANEAIRQCNDTIAQFRQENELMGRKLNHSSFNQAEIDSKANALQALFNQERGMMQNEIAHLNQTISNLQKSIEKSSRVSEEAEEKSKKLISKLENDLKFSQDSGN